MSCSLTDKVETLENLIRLWVICLREAARALPFNALATPSPGQFALNKQYEEAWNGARL